MRPPPREEGRIKKSSCSKVENRSAVNNQWISPNKLAQRSIVVPWRSVFFCCFVSAPAISQQDLATASRSSVSIRGRRCKNLPHIQFDLRAKFGCYFSYCARACWRSQNLGDLGLRIDPLGCLRGEPPRNMLLRHMCYRAKFSHSSSHRTSVIMEILQKVLTPHALPFKVSRGHQNRHGSIGYL